MPIDLNALSAKQQATALYVAYFDRAPDPAGLDFWTTQIQNGLSIEAASAAFSGSDEALGIFPFLAAPNVASIATFLNSVYQNFFGRAPDTEGAAFWTGVLQSGAITPADFVLIAARSAPAFLLVFRFVVLPTDGGSDGQFLFGQFSVGVSIERHFVATKAASRNFTAVEQAVAVAVVPPHDVFRSLEILRQNGHLETVRLRPKAGQ